MARRSDHSRDEIKSMALTAAERIVELQGYQALSARKIAKEIGYTVGTLYLVFENLEDLILQLNGATLDELYLEMEKSVDNGKKPKSAIKAISKAYIDFANAHKEKWQIIFEHAHAKDKLLPVWYQEKIGRMFSLVEDQFSLLLENQSRNKCTLAARALWCGVHGVCILALTRKLEITGLSSVQALIDSLVDNFLAGLTINKK